MEIIRAQHSGFCFGVKRAVEGCFEELKKAKQEGAKLYCLGSLIHNKQVTEELSANGLIFVDSPMQVPAGGKLLIRAHGEPDSTYKVAQERNIQIIDFTCPLVARIHKIAKDAEAKGQALLVIGNENHPEAKGILGSSGNTLGATESPTKAAEIVSSYNGNVCVVSQTTMPQELFTLCGINIMASKPGTRLENTVCSATKDRLQSAAELAEKCDAMVVIGDKTSSNSLKLYETCQKHCKCVVFAENQAEKSLQSLGLYNKIGVAASASAPERIIKEVISRMSELFTPNKDNPMFELLEEIEKSTRLPQRGEIVDGSVVAINNDQVVVNLGCKKDGILPVEEVTLEEGQTLASAFNVGDAIQAKVLKTDDGEGNILLSKKRIQSGENWDEIAAALESREVIEVSVVKEVKGGVIANYKEVSGFIPMSQLADHYVESAAEFIGKTLPVRVSRVDQKKNKAVFSHKAFLTEERSKKIAEIWDTLSVGDVVEGKVMRFTEYGAFVDIGGIDGLLHISEISWGKLKHPQEVLEIGQTVNVKILSMNSEKGKISLGLKQNAPEPWSIIDEQYHVGDIIKGKVVQIKEYGAFIELAPGLDGLVHISEIAHKRVNKVADELAIGQEVEAKILEIDKERKRISLSIKATIEAPAAPEKAEEAAEAPAEAPAEA